MQRCKELENATAELFKYFNLYYLNITNYRCFKCGQVQNSKAKGFPDFHVPSLSLYVECKTGKGKLSKGQENVREIILSNPNNTYILLTDTTDKLIEYLTRAKQ